MKIGVITAMSSERAQIASMISNPSKVEVGPYSFIFGTVGNNQIALMECGIGKVNAALGASALIRAYKPDCIISTGVAGGIDTCLNVMEVVAAKEVVYHDVDCGPENELGQVQGLPPRFAGDANLLEAVARLQSPVKIHTGLTVSGDKFVSRKEDLDAIKAAFPEALAVDMESGAIAQTCHIYGVPFLSFRIISDVPGGKNHFAEYKDFWKEMADRSFTVTRSFLSQITGSIKK